MAHLSHCAPHPAWSWPSVVFRMGNNPRVWKMRWPKHLTGKISLLVHDIDHRDCVDGLRNRITFLRWLLLALAITAQYCSRVFRQRHPDLKSLERVGLATAAEIVRTVLKHCTTPPPSRPKYRHQHHPQHPQHPQHQPLH